MSNFSIGISGLNAAQRAIDIIGNNIANAATPGYHRQRINLTPAYCSQTGAVIIGGGVNAESVTRMIDNLLEKEILRQGSTLEQVSQEFNTLRTVENAFGELSTNGGLNAAMDSFFNALGDLSNHTGEIIWQNQVLTSAEAMASQFRTLGEFLAKLDAQITLEAENIVDQANLLINQIAKLNNDIEKMELGGTNANNLRDQRDQYITELSKLVGVEVLDREYGVVDVEAGGIAVVTGASATNLEIGTQDDGSLGLTIAGLFNYSSDIEGGRLGGLFSLKNTLITDVHNELDSLASALIRQVNQYHVQGVGSAGSFNRLDGWPVTTEVLADWEPPISTGEIYIRVTDTTTQTVTRNEIDLSSIVPADPMVGLTLSDVAGEISAVTGLNCWANASGLHIEQSSADYEFDFLPAVLPSPTASTLTGAAPPTISVSGIYTGTENDTFSFSVSGAGSVGNGSLLLTVKDGAGETIKTLNIGDGYAAGDILDVGNGIEISLTTGDFGAGDNFDVGAFYSTDTSGLLAAAGINTFFSGNTASNISICSAISAAPDRIATSLGPEMNDNQNSLRLIAVKDQALSSLNNISPGSFYRKMVTDIGQELAVRQIREDNLNVIVQNLTSQQSQISGVDINDEAAQLLIFEQIFQSMAKYMNVLHASMQSILEIL